MKITRQKFLLITLTLLALSIGLTAGASIERRVLFLQSSDPPNTTQDFGLIAQAWNIIEKEYVDRKAVDSTQLTYGAISGMVDALGDTGHSTFLSPEMVKEEQSLTQGQFDGIGIEIQVKDGQIVIVSSMDGSPAQKAGLHTGETILKVNGTDVSGLPLEQVVKQVLGPAGTWVTLTIQEPDNGQTREVSIKRAHINIQNVTWQMIPGTTIAHVRLAGFSQGVTQDLKKALKEIQDQGGTKMILDLRNNPGGLLSEAVGVASQFLTNGNVLLEKNAKGDMRPVPVERGGVAPNIPMVVLVNYGTASAAEIVSGALQDAHRALIVGETTFGTGTVLNKFALSDGSALMLATDEWLTPTGLTIWHHGITPNVKVALSTNVTPLIPEAEKGITKTQLSESGDAQLLHALDILNGLGGTNPSGKPGN